MKHLNILLFKLATLSIFLVIGLLFSNQCYATPEFGVPEESADDFKIVITGDGDFPTISKESGRDYHLDDWNLDINVREAGYWDDELTISGSIQHKHGPNIPFEIKIDDAMNYPDGENEIESAPIVRIHELEPISGTDTINTKLVFSVTSKVKVWIDYKDITSYEFTLVGTHRPSSQYTDVIRATAKGSMEPLVETDPVVTNGNFTITDVGGITNTGTGDGIDEITTWTFDFTGDPQFDAFNPLVPFISAPLTVELTRKGDLFFTDTIGIDVKGLSAITDFFPRFVIQKNATKRYHLNLLDFYTPTDLMTVFTDHGGRIPMLYADDSVVSSAKLELMSFFGRKLNDKFPRLDPGDTSRTFESTPCAPEAPIGTYTIGATFKNISGDTLGILSFIVVELSGGNVLCNADGGTGGDGSRLSVSLEIREENGLFVPPELLPGESFFIEFKIGLASWQPFTFKVDIYGAQ